MREEELATLEQFRQQIYSCMRRGADAMFKVCDALLCESQAQSLVELSLSAVFERKWPSVYEALSDGEIDMKGVREVVVKTLLAFKSQDEAIWMAVDATSIPRADAHTSEDRGYIHLSNLPVVDKPLSVGWQYSHVVLLPETPSSWVPPFDSRRIATQQTPIEVAIEQLRALRPLLGTRRVIVVADRAYATPEFLRACHDLGYTCLVRLKSDRRLYGPGVRIHNSGPIPKDGALFQGKGKQTHPEPDALWDGTDPKGRPMHVRRFGRLHFREDRSLPVQIIEVEREAAKGSKRDPRHSWFVTLDASIPLQELPMRYAGRFSEEHGFRFLKQDLLWTAVPVRTPEQFERWSWLVAIVMSELYLARDLGQALHRPWERKHRPVTPAQVRQMMPVILALLGTPARPCRPRGVSPGRPKGFRPTPAPRFPVVRKHPKTGPKTIVPLQDSA